MRDNASALACVVVDKALIDVPREPVGQAENIPENRNQDAAFDPFGSAWGRQERIHVPTGSYV